MAKEKNSKVNLEKVANEGMSFSINEMSDKETDITKKIPMWVQSYVSKNYGEDQALATYKILRGDPLSVAQLITQARTEHESNLVKEVKKNPYTVIKATDKNHIIGLASQFFGSANYKTLKEVIENNGDVKTEYSKAFEGNLWKDTVAGATPGAVTSAANEYIQETIQREIVKNLCNQGGNFDADKTSKYIVENIKQAGEKQDALYKELGLAYMQTKISKQ